MDSVQNKWETVSMGHFRGGRFQELVPYLRFLGKRSLWRAAGRQISLDLPRRSLPNYLGEGAQAEESFHPFLSKGGPVPLSKGDSTGRETLASIKEAPSFFNRNWPISDKERAYYSARCGWIWPSLERAPCLQTASFLFELVKRELLHSTHDVETLNNPYTTAEQLSNTFLLYWILLRSGASSDLISLQTELAPRADYLAKNLEYYGEGSRTNNHLLNNARALYLSGIFLEREEWRKMARAIFRNEVERSLTKSGFLREGSSSYQLLILRWFQEIERAAYCAGDTNFHEWAKTQVLRLRAAARFFCPHRGDLFPLFGDVSPDAPPEWLIPLIHGEAKGWNALWYLPMETSPDSGPEGLTSYLEEGWARYDGYRYRLFWHVNPVGAIGLYSHAHHDTGSFTLQCGGEEIFVDPGRPTYALTAVGLYFKSAAAHNLFVIGGREPFVSAGLNGTRLFLPEYGRARVSTKATGNSLSIRHDGYLRFPGLGEVSRRFQMESSRIVIYDEAHGQGWHTVDTFFHLDPGVECELFAGSVLLKTKAGRKLILKERIPSGAKPIVHWADRGDSLLGGVSPRYGEVCHSTTLHWRRRVKFPMNQSWVLEMN